MRSNLHFDSHLYDGVDHCEGRLAAKRSGHVYDLGHNYILCLSTKVTISGPGTWSYYHPNRVFVSSQNAQNTESTPHLSHCYTITLGLTKHDSEPCIRGHRSSRCEHFDRFMVQVARPGRPLSTCPHPKNQCNCGKEKVMMIRIPKGKGTVRRSTSYQNACLLFSSLSLRMYAIVYPPTAWPSK